MHTYWLKIIIRLILFFDFSFYIKFNNKVLRSNSNNLNDKFLFKKSIMSLFSVLILSTVLNKFPKTFSNQD